MSREDRFPAADRVEADNKLPIDAAIGYAFTPFLRRTFTPRRLLISMRDKTIIVLIRINGKREMNREIQQQMAFTESRQQTPDNACFIEEVHPSGRAMDYVLTPLRPSYAEHSRYFRPLILCTAEKPNESLPKQNRKKG